MTGVAEVLAVLDTDVARSPTEIADECGCSADIASAHLNNLQKVGKCKRTAEGWVKVEPSMAVVKAAREICGTAAPKEESAPLRGDLLTVKIVDALRSAGTVGLSRTSIRDLFHRNVSAPALEAALATLEANGSAFRRMVPTMGRPGETWFIAGALAAPPTVESQLIPRASATMAKPDKAETGTALLIHAPESKPAVPRFVDAKVEERSPGAKPRPRYWDAVVELRAERDKLDAAILALEALG